MIVAFTGKKRHGKSRAAEYAQAKLGAVRINFKDAIVDELRENFPDLVREMCTFMEKHYWDGKAWTFERLIEEKPPLFRALMQNYGTQVRRGDRDTYWVDEWDERTLGYDTIVTDDARFLNEAQAVKMLGGIIIRVVREGYDTTTDTHVSETEMDSIVADYTIVAKDLDELYAQLDVILAGV